MVGIRKGVRYKKMVEWEYGLVILGLSIEKEEEINVIVGYNSGKMREVVGELEKIVEGLEREGETVLIREKREVASRGGKEKLGR